jgi:hypothetical protein
MIDVEEGGVCLEGSPQCAAVRGAVAVVAFALEDRESTRAGEAEGPD